MNLHRFILITAIIGLIYKTCSAQILPGAKQIALSHADVAGSSDVFSVFNNPAGLSNISDTQIGIYYSPSPFGLKQLANGFCAFAKTLSLVPLQLGFLLTALNYIKRINLLFPSQKILMKTFPPVFQFFIIPFQ